MPRISGKIEKVFNKEINTKHGRTNKFSMKIKDEWYSGFGDCPYTEGQEVNNMEYDENKVTNQDGSETVFYNVKMPNKTERAIQKEISPKLDQQAELLRNLIEAQTLPKVHVGVTKKAGDYNKNEYSMNLTFHVQLEEAKDVNKLKELMDLVNKVVDQKISEDFPKESKHNFKTAGPEGQEFD